MARTMYCLLVIFVLAISLFPVPAKPQQDGSDWTKWTRKDAEKILKDSAWSQEQVETDVSEMFFSPTSDPNRSRPTGNDSARLNQGATNQAISVKYMVRFFSARPVRRALARMMELQQDPPAEIVQKLHTFADVVAKDSIIVTLTAESTDQRAARSVMQSINSAITATLKNDTYLERNGKRLFLEEYIPPGKDGFGARFIFLRTLDERPFIDDKNGEVRFYAKYPNGPKIDRRFKVSEMIYNGALEY
jgi:hypothetical protein